MKTKYICPVCGGVLNVNDNVVLIAQNAHGEKGLVFLHTELGNYQSQISSSLVVKEGDFVDFLCPYCHSNIDYHKEKSALAMLMLVDQKGRKSKVLFSKVYGEECTHELNEDNSIKTYGECLKKYMDPEWYLK